jgi:nucleoside-diphosphate-sugar epimerase
MIAVSSSRVLVTGARGFTGRYLIKTLAQRGHEVYSLVGDGESPVSSDATEQVADLLNPGVLIDVIKDVQPHFVIHLAAIAFVAHGDIDLLYRTNIVGTRNLLHALSECSPTIIRRVLIASSANVYGNATEQPIDENVSPQPTNDYAVSKLAMEFVANLWRDQLPITILRPFNYTGVGQSLQFLLPKIVKAFSSHAAFLELGNLHVERDFSDVRDVVNAYVRLLDAPPVALVNVCSGAVHSLKNILALAQEITGHSPTININPAFIRANEVHRLQGSNQRLKSLIGDWQPRPIRDTLAWMLGIR